MTYDIEYSEKDVDIIDNFLRKQKFHDDVVYAIIPTVSSKLGLHYEIIIELRLCNVVVPKKKVVKIERLFCDFRAMCNKNNMDICVRFYLQRTDSTKNVLYKTMTSETNEQ